MLRQSGSKEENQKKRIEKREMRGQSGHFALIIKLIRLLERDKTQMPTIREVMEEAEKIRHKPGVPL